MRLRLSALIKNYSDKMFACYILFLVRTLKTQLILHQS